MLSTNPQITFQEYYQLFKTGLQKNPGIDLQPLAHGGAVARIKQSQPCLAIISGLHGDERSGPLALLEWVYKREKPLGAEKHSLWLLPLLNDEGWDKNERLWQGIDLNRAFLPESVETPAFVRQVMTDWARQPPEMFLDIHEDSTRPNEPYLYWYKEEAHDMALELANYLQAQSEPWENCDYWRGSDEVYLRALGCQYCFTIEAPFGWPMQDRIKWNQAAIEWCLEHLSDSMAS